MDTIAVLDFGKTHSKLMVVDAQSGNTIHAVERPAAALPGPFCRQLDIHGAEEWLLAELAALPDKQFIRALVPIAHGAAAVLLDAQGRALVAPDYEDALFDRVGAAYAAERDAYSATFSPLLGAGLNLGKQLYYLQTCEAKLFAQVSRILLYPQYWAWRLGGEYASELTSLGSHSDLWRITDARFSDLAIRRGWNALLPPVRGAGETLGTLRDHLSYTTGLPADCRVLCGIHDSNASYLPHRVQRSGTEPFAVVSSGTWTIVMAHATDLARLDENRDMLANLDAFGSPVATARYLGGREYAAIAGDARSLAPDWDDVAAYLQGEVPTGVAARAALATLSVALMTDHLLSALGARGDVIIDGPLADNACYAPILAALRPENPVLASSLRAGPADASRYLAGYRDLPPRRSDRVAPVELKGLAGFQTRWRALTIDSRPGGAGC